MIVFHGTEKLFLMGYSYISSIIGLLFFEMLQGFTLDKSRYFPVYLFFINLQNGLNSISIGSWAFFQDRKYSARLSHCILNTKSFLYNIGYGDLIFRHREILQFVFELWVITSYTYRHRFLLISFAHLQFSLSRIFVSNR